MKKEVKKTNKQMNRNLVRKSSKKLDYEESEKLVDSWKNSNDDFSKKIDFFLKKANSKR